MNNADLSASSKDKVIESNEFSQEELLCFLEMKKYQRRNDRAKIVSKAFMIFMLQISLLVSLFIFFTR